MLAMFGSARLLLIGLAALAIVTAVGGFLVDWRHTQAALARAAGALAVERATNDANIAEVDRIREDAARAVKAVEAERAAGEKRAAARAAIMQGVTDEKPSDDAPIAPVLRRVLLSLFGGSAGGGRDQGYPAGDPGGAARLRGGAASP